MICYCHVSWYVTCVGKPADVDEPLDGVDHNGVFGDDDVEREPVDPMRPLFSHPGILAGMISNIIALCRCVNSVTGLCVYFL